MQTYKTELIVDTSFSDELDKLRNDPRAMAQLTAHMRYVSLMFSAKMFGFSEGRSREWALAQMTDAERTALAHETESVPRPLLTEGNG